MNRVRINILLVGSALWVKYLNDLLNMHAADMVLSRFVAVPNKNPWDILKASRGADLVLRVGFRPGMTNWKPYAFDMFWSLLRRIRRRIAWGYYWIGSDVSMIVRECKDNHVTSFFRRALADFHLAGAPWFVDELRETGICAVDCLFPGELPESDAESLRFTGGFRVLSYIPDKNPEFYGGHAIYQAANALPEVRFDIVGGAGNWVDKALPNMKFHGWQEDLRPFYLNAQVVARLVPHDAVGGTVREALALGRQVIYTYPLPFVHHVHWGDNEGLVRNINDLHREYGNGRLVPNVEGREYALKEWDPISLTRNLASILCSMVNPWNRDVPSEETGS